MDAEFSLPTVIVLILSSLGLIEASPLRGRKTIEQGASEEVLYGTCTGKFTRRPRRELARWPAGDSVCERNSVGRIRTQVGMRLEVIEHLCHLGGSRKPSFDPHEPGNAIDDQTKAFLTLPSLFGAVSCGCHHQIV